MIEILSSAEYERRLRGAMEIVAAVGEAIRDLKEVPSGHLYARLMGSMSLEEYQFVIDILIRAELVERDPSHLLRWIGPKERVQ